MLEFKDIPQEEKDIFLEAARALVVAKVSAEDLAEVIYVSGLHAMGGGFECVNRLIELYIETHATAGNEQVIFVLKEFHKHFAQLRSVLLDKDIPKEMDAKVGVALLQGQEEQSSVPPEEPTTT